MSVLSSTAVSNVIKLFWNLDFPKLRNWKSVSYDDGIYTKMQSQNFVLEQTNTLNPSNVYKSLDTLAYNDW